MKYRPLLTLLLVATLFPAWAKANPMTLTPAGVAAGFSLTTFASNFPDASSFGPFGIAFTSLGVLVSDYPAGSVLIFPSDTDGQNASSVAAVPGYSQPLGIAKLDNNFYLAEKSPGEVVQISSDGTLARDIVGLNGATGVVADPLTGKLFVSNVSTGIYAVDPGSKTTNLFVSGSFDGLTLSPDGKILYAAAYGVGIQGFDTATGKLVFSSVHARYRWNSLGVWLFERRHLRKHQLWPSDRSELVNGRPNIDRQRRFARGTSSLRTPITVRSCSYRAGFSGKSPTILSRSMP